VVLLRAHLVFTPKYRRKVFERTHLDTLREIFAQAGGRVGAALVEMNGEHDHVHLLVNYPPHVQLSKRVNSLKGVSSRTLRQRFPEIEKRPC
jgi:putative transposase